MKHIKKHLTAGCLIIIGALFITVGSIRKEPDTVLQKAIHICLECIGIG